MKTSIFGLSENWAAALAYLFGFITAIPILIIERENRFVRFAALQSTIASLIITLIMSAFSFLSGFLPLVGWIFGMVGWLLSIGVFMGWLFMLIMSATGKAVRIPIIGDACHDQIYK